MKLIILIWLSFSRSVSEGYPHRLPSLTMRLNIEDPLHLYSLSKAATSLFKATISVFNVIDTKEESNFRQFLNTKELTTKDPIDRPLATTIASQKFLPRPNPNSFFPYLYCTANSKILTTNPTTKISPRPLLN